MCRKEPKTMKFSVNATFGAEITEFEDCSQWSNHCKKILRPRSELEFQQTTWFSFVGKAESSVCRKSCSARFSFMFKAVWIIVVFNAP